MSEAVFLADDDWARALPALAALKHLLVRDDFELTARLPHPGNPLDLVLEPANLLAWHRGDSNLFHRSALDGLFRRRLAHRHPRAVAFHELLTLGRSLDGRHAGALLGAGLLDALLGVGVLEALGEQVRANVLAVATSGRLHVSDPARLQGHPEYVYAGRSSFSASDYLSALDWSPAPRPRDGPRRLLDLGCGAGFAALAAAAEGVEQVVGSDVVERCLRFARLNAALNGQDTVEFVRSDLFEAIAGDFDLIVSNAPCVWEELQQATFATGGGVFGTELPMRMISQSLERLRPNGMLVVVMAAPVVRRRAFVLDAVSQACGDRDVEVFIHPLFSEYELRHAEAYRRSGVSRSVRYLVAIASGERRSIELLRAGSVRSACYRLRAGAVRLVGSLAPRRPDAGGRPG